jgi:hypothetical protein
MQCQSTHDQENNLITIERYGIMYIITITKHLDSNTEGLEVLLCYDFVNRITNKEEDVFLEVVLNLFAIRTITLPKLEILSACVTSLEFNIKDLIFDFSHMLSKILIDVIFIRIKVQDLRIAKWTLSKEVQVRSFNLGTNQKP